MRKRDIAEQHKPMVAYEGGSAGVQRLANLRAEVPRFSRDGLRIHRAVNCLNQRRFVHRALHNRALLRIPFGKLRRFASMYA